MKRKEIAIAIVYFVLGIGVCILGNMTMDAYDNTIEDARYQGYNQGYDDGWQIGFEKGLE